MNKSPETLIGRATCEARPSLALTKYWGKQDSDRNIPATPSLALTLDGLQTRTETEIHSIPPGSMPRDTVAIGEGAQNPHRFRAFFSSLRYRAALAGWKGGEFQVRAVSQSNFPQAAGLASSASGFAALAIACLRALNLTLPMREVSALARSGSASAARSVYGGFTLLPAGGEAADQLFDEAWWPNLRVLVLTVVEGPKAIPSREAMESTRCSSPYYGAWTADAQTTTEAACRALENRDLAELGPLVRRSSLRMFAAMLAADPPVRYWAPKTLAVLDVLDHLRSGGLQVWETMDAGPQVKVLCLEPDLPALLDRMNRAFPEMSKRICRPGAAPTIL